MEVPMRHTGNIREALMQCVLDAGGNEGRTGARVLEEAGNGRERNERGMTTCTAVANGGTGGGDADTHTQRTTDAPPEGTLSGEEGGGGDRPGRPDMQCQCADPVFALCSGNRSRARAQGCGIEREEDASGRKLGSLSCGARGRGGRDGAELHQGHVCSSADTQDECARVVRLILLSSREDTCTAYVRLKSGLSHVQYARATNKTNLRRLENSLALRRVTLDDERIHPHPGMPVSHPVNQIRETRATAAELSIGTEWKTEGDGNVS